METRKYLFETMFKQFLNEQDTENLAALRKAVGRYLDTIEQIFAWALEVVGSGSDSEKADRPINWFETPGAKTIRDLESLLDKFKGDSAGYGISSGIVGGVININSKSIRTFTARYDMQFTSEIYFAVSKYLDEMEGKIFAGQLDSLVRAGNALLNQIATELDDPDPAPVATNWYEASGFRSIMELDRAIAKINQTISNIRIKK